MNILAALLFLLASGASWYGWHAAYKSWMARYSLVDPPAILFFAFSGTFFFLYAIRQLV